MEEEKLKRLLREYQTGVIKKNDLIDLLEYVAKVENEPTIDPLLSELMEEMEEDSALLLESENLYKRIITHPHFMSHKRKSVRLWYYWASIAAGVLIVLGGFWWYTEQNKGLMFGDLSSEIRTITSAPSDRLILKTSDGKVIDLDSELIDESLGIPSLRFSDDGGLIYDANGNMISPEEHTIMTPKGRQYHIVLSDGTKVWLNSATTMTFPVKFSGDLREIKLDGEAYFEVERASDWPFLV